MKCFTNSQNLPESIISYTLGSFKVKLVVGHPVRSNKASYGDPPVRVLYPPCNFAYAFSKRRTHRSLFLLLEKTGYPLGKQGI